MLAHQHKVGLKDAAICLGLTFEYSFSMFGILEEGSRRNRFFLNLCVTATKRNKHGAATMQA